MTLFTSITVEILLDGVSWTDVTSRLDKTAVTVKQGRPDPYSDIAPGVLSLVLANPDGYLMPDNTSAPSPYVGNVGEPRQIRLKLTHGGVTYTRFWGYVTEWVPSFPGATTTQAVVSVKALDNLSLLARKDMYSVWVEAARFNALSSATFVDMFILKGDGTATQYFDNPSTSTTKMRATTVAATNNKGPLSFGEAEGLSIDGAATFAPASDHTGMVIKMEALSERVLQFWLKVPAEQQVDATTPQLDLVSFWDSTNTTTYGSLRFTNNAGTTDLGWFNAAGTFISQVAQLVNEERWVRVSLLTKTATPTTTDVFYDNGTPGALNVAMDLRNVRHVWFGGRGTLVPKMTIAGPIMLGDESATVEVQQGLTAGSPWTVEDRILFAGVASPTGPPTTEGLVSGTAPALTGNWHGRKALAVHHEIARSGQGVFWARSRDSVPLHLAADATYPTASVATVNLEEDASGTPELARDVATRPTRLTVTFPGGKALVVDTAAETAAGDQETPGRTLETVTDSFTSAEALGYAELAKGRRGLRIRQVTIDLETAAHNLVPALFDESTSRGGLFPTQRLTLSGLPSAFFSGATTMDVFAEGWLESYSDAASTIAIDCSSAAATTIASSDFTGTNGAALPAPWGTGTSTTGATGVINANQARLNSGTLTAGNGRRSMYVTTSTYKDAMVSGLITVSAVASLTQIYVRSATSAIDTFEGYYLLIETSGNHTIGRSNGYVDTTLGSFTRALTAGVQYGFRFYCVGPQIRGRMWTGAEPSLWDAAAFDSGLTAAGYVGITVANVAAANAVVDLDNIVVTSN